jgi:hypothetical protein
MSLLDFELTVIYSQIAPDEFQLEDCLQRSASLFYYRSILPEESPDLGLGRSDPAGVIERELLVSLV